jgi:hypothetical protein
MRGMLGTSVDLLVVMTLKMKTSKRAINLTWNDIRELKIIKKREYNHYYLLGREGCLERV